MLKNSDFRKAVKVKPPKKKDPLKGKIPSEASAVKKKKGKKEKVPEDILANFKSLGSVMAITNAGQGYTKY